MGHFLIPSGKRLSLFFSSMILYNTLISILLFILNVCSIGRFDHNKIIFSNSIHNIK